MGRNLFALSQSAHQHAIQVASLLRGALTNEVLALINQGFVVPSAESLHNAAKVFDYVATLPGWNGAIGGVTHTSLERLNLICAFATNMQSMLEAIDLVWSNAWPVNLQTNETIYTLMYQVLAQWNANQASELLVEMEASFKNAEAEEIRSR